MGIYDRDYYRGDEPGGFHFRGVGSLTMVTKLVIVTSALFVAGLLLGTSQNPDWLMDLMAVHVNTMDKPWMWWQWLTSGFSHAGPRHLLFNMLGLWFLGRAVEMRIGSSEFLRFYLIAIVLGSIFWGVRHYLQFGPDAEHTARASGAVTAAVMLFVFYFPKETIYLFGVIPMPAWLLGVILIAGNLMGTRREVAYDVHLVGAAFAAVYYFAGLNFGRMIPAGMNPGRWLRRGPKLKVHQPGPDKSQQLDSEADRVLEKLHREGEESLTRKERRVLEAYSRRMRQKKQKHL